MLVSRVTFIQAFLILLLKGTDQWTLRESSNCELKRKVSPLISRPIEYNSCLSQHLSKLCFFSSFFFTFPMELVFEYLNVHGPVLAYKIC